MTGSPSRPSRSRTVARAFGFTRLIVELGVFSSLVFSLALFIAAIVQAYFTIGDALRHLGEENTTRHLLIAATEQTDTLLVGMALLIISLGLQAPFIGEVRNVPAWLRVQTFDDRGEKLIGIVVTALGVNFFSVALEWRGGPDILRYGAAIAAVVLAVGASSLVLARQGAVQDSLPAHEEADAHPHP